MKKTRPRFYYVITFLIVFTAVTLGAILMLAARRRRRKNREQSILRQGGVIYCIMITGKDDARIRLARHAVHNFTQQTYPHKRLLILNHHPTKKVIQDDDHDHRDILELQVDKQKERLSLGALRNMALEMVPFNASWITWDDDDYRRPDFLAALATSRDASGVDVVAISRRMEYNINTEFVWRMTLRSGMVFALCRKIPPTEFQYLDKDSMEDVDLLTSYRRAGYKVDVIENDPLLYIRVVHDNNTSLYVDPNKDRVVRTRHDAAYSESEATPQEKALVTQWMRLILDHP